MINLEISLNICPDDSGKTCFAQQPKQNQTLGDKNFSPKKLAVNTVASCWITKKSFKHERRKCKYETASKKGILVKIFQAQDK
jgi:hypothetical protein